MAKAAVGCKAALEALKNSKDCNLEDMERVELWGQCPPLERMDASLGALRRCRHLSLSTNNIDRVGGLAGLECLEVLSLARNSLKRLDGVEAAAACLCELWVSYNQLERLAGVERCLRLRVLYASNNRLRHWGEVDRLARLPELEDLLLVGNPLHSEHREAGTLTQYRAEVLRRLPQLKRLDGQPVLPEERDAVVAARKACEGG